MKITYDDLVEFAEVRLRCENTRKKSMCKYCPFYDRCEVDDNENLHTMCCDILSTQQNEVTKNQVKETVKCAECKYLTLVNQKDCYARCEKTKQKFLPFGVDTREYTCEYAEKQNEVTKK